MLHKLAALEAGPDRDPTDVDSVEDDDPHVVPRILDLEFTPYEVFKKSLPGMEKDFFRNPLPEAERRR